MRHKLAAKNDFLGIVALGSVIGNIVQAADRTNLQTLYRQLETMYRNLVQHYQLLYRDYNALKQLNNELQRQVTSLRTENSKLLEKSVRKELV
jgi:hypothetical protein